MKQTELQPLVDQLIDAAATSFDETAGDAYSPSLSAVLNWQAAIRQRFLQILQYHVDRPT